MKQNQINSHADIKTKITDMYGPPISQESYKSFLFRKFKKEFTFCTITNNLPS